jgi:hypothetical protein
MDNNSPFALIPKPTNKLLVAQFFAMADLVKDIGDKGLPQDQIEQLLSKHFQLRLKKLENPHELNQNIELIESDVEFRKKFNSSIENFPSSPLMEALSTMPAEFLNIGCLHIEKYAGAIRDGDFLFLACDHYALATAIAINLEQVKIGSTYKDVFILTEGIYAKLKSRNSLPQQMMTIAKSIDAKELAVHSLVATQIVWNLYGENIVEEVIAQKIREGKYELRRWKSDL